MTFWGFVSEHYIAATFMLFIICWCIHDTTVAIMNGRIAIAQAQSHPKLPADR